MNPNKSLRNLIEAKDTRVSDYLADIETAILGLERAAKKVRDLLEEDDGEFVPSRVLQVMDRIDRGIDDLKKDHNI
jgi:hypothetical protein